MTLDEYEQRRRRLDEQLRSGIELLEAAHRQQVRALELVWMTTADEDLTLPQTPVRDTESSFSSEAVEGPQVPASAEPLRPSRRTAWQLSEEVEGILDTLPEVFDRNHVSQALGHEPDRGSLYRVLEQLARDGVFSIQMRGAGKVPTKYRKTGTSTSPGVM